MVTWYLEGVKPDLEATGVTVLIKEGNKLLVLKKDNSIKSIFYKA